MAVTAALLHRVGGVNAYAFDGCLPDYTLLGKLIGVKTLTIQLLTASITELWGAKPDGFELDIAHQLLHAIVAQDWNREVKPMTKEAILLQEAVRADMHLTGALDFMDMDMNSGPFTAFDPIAKTQYYRGTT